MRCSHIYGHGRACFPLLKHGQLLGESVRAAGTVYGGTELVVAALWALRGFNRPTGVDKETRLIAKGAQRAVGNGPVDYKQPYATTTASFTASVPVTLS
jgi:hypothetical protein